MNLPAGEFRAALLHWYDAARRRLPWRETQDPYAILVSEIMLQQTRVAAAIPYYERFLRRFPTLQTLAEAPEQEVLAAWSGLGYYYRARNLQKAAQTMMAAGGFPSDYDGIRALPGVGAYTVAAVGSIAFGLPHAVLDGNVLRVLSRVLRDHGDISTLAVKRRLQGEADALLDPARPGDYNQAVMELGATICLPRGPQCLLCPVQQLCQARQHGEQDQLPVNRKKTGFVFPERTIYLIARGDKLLFYQRPPESSLMPGFYELPEAEQLPKARVEAELGSFRHTITHHHYTWHVARATLKTVPRGLYWLSEEERNTLPISTVARKAIRRFFL